MCHGKCAMLQIHQGDKDLHRDGHPGYLGNLAATQTLLHVISRSFKSGMIGFDDAVFKML